MSPSDGATLRLVVITACALCCSIASIGGTAAAMEGIKLPEPIQAKARV